MWKISQKGGGRNRAGVPRWYPRTSRAALRVVWWLLAAGRVVMARRVSRRSGSGSEIDASRSSLQAPTYARTLASSTSTDLRICPRGPLSGPYSGALGAPQRSWGLVSASLDSYRGVLWPEG